MNVPREGTLLGDVCSIRSGFTSRKRLEPKLAGGALTVQQSDMDASGYYAAGQALRTDASAAAPHHYVAPEELVFRSRGPIWSAGILPALDEPVLAIAPLFILHPDPDTLNPGYLAWFLGRPSAQRYFDSEAQGSGVLMITKAVLARLPVNVPALDVQEGIAHVAALSAEERQLSERVSVLRHELLSRRLDRLASSPTPSLDPKENQ